MEKFSYNVIKVDKKFVITFLFVFEINLSHTKRKKNLNSESRLIKDFLGGQFSGHFMSWVTFFKCEICIGQKVKMRGYQPSTRA